jgi:hypothetical protein
LDNEASIIERTCEKWGFFAKISKLQLIIIDKQLKACHRNSNIYEDGRIIQCCFEVSHEKYTNFISVYGIPHFLGQHQDDENERLQKMTALQRQLKNSLQRH